MGYRARKHAVRTAQWLCGGWHVIARTDIATLHDYQTTLRHHSGRTLTHFHPPLPNGNRQASQSLRNSVGSRFGGGSVPSQRLSR